MFVIPLSIVLVREFFPLPFPDLLIAWPCPLLLPLNLRICFPLLRFKNTHLLPVLSTTFDCPDTALSPSTLALHTVSYPGSTREASLFRITPVHFSHTSLSSVLSLLSRRRLTSPAHLLIMYFFGLPKAWRYLLYVSPSKDILGSWAPFPYPQGIQPLPPRGNRFFPGLDSRLLKTYGLPIPARSLTHSTLLLLWFVFLMR